DYFIECVSARSVGAGIKIAELVMLSWVVTFLIIALIAGILGFGGIAGVSIEIAKAIFFIAVVLFIISAVVGLARGRTRVWSDRDIAGWLKRVQCLPIEVLRPLLVFNWRPPS